MYVLNVLNLMFTFQINKLVIFQIFKININFMT